MNSETPQAQNSVSGGNQPLIDQTRTSQYASECQQMLDRLPRISNLEKIVDPSSETELAGQAKKSLDVLTRTAAMTAAIRVHIEPRVVKDLKAFLDDYEADLERWASQDSQMATTMAESTKVSVKSYRDKLKQISNTILDLARVANVFTRVLLRQKAELDKFKLEVEDYTPTRVLIPNDKLVEGADDAELLVQRNMTCKWVEPGKEATVKKMHNRIGAPFKTPKFSIWKMVINDSAYVAAKAFTARPEAEQEDNQRLKRLADVWKGMDHPNVLPLLGACRFENDPKLYLISPWMKYGTVRAYITYHPEADRLQLIHDVALGLQYIHSRNLVHGKLRSDNILVDLNRRARISGFSLTKKFTGRAQTKDWYAFTDDGRWNPTKQAIWTAKSDIWCWAMTALEILSGDRPFSDIPSISCDDLQKIQKGTLRPAREDYKSSIPSDHLWGLLESCWSVEENERPDIGTVVQEVANERIRTGWDPLKWNPKPGPKKDWDWPESS